MDGFSPATLWWLLAGLLVIAELLTGTFYLLAMALAAACAALAAHLGLGSTAQILVAAAVGGIAASGLAQWRKMHPPAPATADPDVNLDIGNIVHVPEWSGDGSARVQHRGSAWNARYAGAGGAQPGPHRIAAVHGNVLHLEPVSGH
jgi:membrane protein implicated in regulation of membrane protease activity